jgi:hypothetical protein
MDEPPSTSRTQYRPRRLGAICCAAVAAALFTPVPATADVINPPRPQAIARTAAVHTPPPEALAQSLISTGMIGIGLSIGGLVIVAYRRRRW